MYSVIAYDGQVYGPVDVRTLIAWCQQGRIVASTHLVETQTGRSFVASDMPELSAVLVQSQAPTLQTNTPQGQIQPAQTKQGQYPFAQNPGGQGASGQPSPYHTPYPTQAQYPPQNPYQSTNPYGASPQQQQFPSSIPGYGAYGAPKSKSISLWLCFLLGPLGAHRFYLGHTNSAIVMLVVGGMSLANNFFLVISLIWCTIDFLRLASGAMADSQGVVPR
jgi:TM2 domain-containing membrane protein YozV